MEKWEARARLQVAADKLLEVNENLTSAEESNYLSEDVSKLINNIKTEISKHIKTIDDAIDEL